VNVLLLLLILVLQGILVGGLARLALPGRDPMSLGQTMLIGIAASLAAGLLSYYVIGRAPAFFISVLFATVIVYLVRRSRGGGLTDPGGAGRGRA